MTDDHCTGGTIRDDGHGGTGGWSRRAFLASGGAASVAAVAGCLGGGSGSGDTPTDAGGTATGSGETPTESVPSVSYRHRFAREGLDPAINDAGVELGIWESEGVDVSFGTSRGSQAAAQAVAQGNDEFGNGEIAAVLKQIQAGSSLTIIGQVLDPLPAVVSLKERGITSWSDLAGKTVAKYPFGVVGPLGKGAYEERTGESPSQIDWQNMQPGSVGKLLMQGEVDAAVTYFPQILALLRHEGYEANALKISDVYDYLGVSLYTRQEVVENRPELVNSFVRGWLKAHQKFVTDLDAVADATREHQETFDMEVELESLGAQYASRVPPTEMGREYGKGWTPSDQLESTQQVFTDLGILEETRPVEEYYTNQFIEQNRDLAVETANVYYEELDENYDIGPNYV